MKIEFEVYDVKKRNWLGFEGDYTGPVTLEALEEEVCAFIRRGYIGGSSEHLSLALGYIPVPSKAYIYEGKDVLVEWKAPAFFVLP